MNEERYSISELAAAAATTPRTIRFYATEGLLPPPLSEGRNAIYTERHRRRLRLIQRLKAAYLPLSAIQEQLVGLSDEQVNALLERGGQHRVENTGIAAQGARAHAPQPSAGPSNVDYVAQILAVANNALAGSGDAPGSDRTKRVLIVSPTLRPDNDSETVTERVAVDNSNAREQWERILIRPGIELHLLHPISTRRRADLDRLIQLARTLLPDN